MALWLPMRTGLVIAAYMHLGLRLDYDADPDAMILFWQPWLLGVLLLPPVLASWRFVSWPAGHAIVVSIGQAAQPLWRPAAALAHRRTWQPVCHLWPVVGSRGHA